MLINKPKLDITPYLSVGQIQFGMTSNELKDAIGLPIRISKNRRQEPVHQFNEFKVIFSANSHRVIEVGLIKESNAWVGNISLFQDADSFNKLIQKEANLYDYMGFKILLNFGLTFTGFQDKDESQKSVTAFAKGRWDKLLSESGLI